MKTIRQWLESELTSTDYNKAVKYSDVTWDNEIITQGFYEALDRAFDWTKTSEGADYWSSIYFNFDTYSLNKSKNAEPKDNIVESVRNDLLSRSITGIKKYGTTLERDDIDLKGWANHTYEELLDAACYLKRIIKELENKG